MSNDGWGSEFKPDLPTRPDVNMGWGGSFPVIPARKTTKFADEFLLPDGPKELDLSEQPFEFDVELQATRVGDLCVHLRLENQHWMVTHVPSLYAFTKGVPEGDFTKRQFLDWCKTVQLNWQDYWAVLREVKENSELNERQSYAAKCLQKHCLKTPVV